MPADRLVGPAVVIDKSREAAADPDYLLTVGDVRAFEAEHGPLPDGGWLLLRTGWDARAHDQDAFLNVEDGRSRTPGPDAECARWLAQETPIAGIGVETVGHRRGRRPAASTRRSPCTRTSSAPASTASRSSPTSRSCRRSGALVVVAPLKLVDGTGSPARVLALVPGGA